MEQNSSRLVSSDESWLQKIQERGAVHQNSAPLLLCSQEHQQACDDRGVRCQRRVCEYVGAHLYCMSASPSVSVSESCSKLCELVRALYPLPGETGLVSKLDSVIGSSENPNEAISISASALLPGVSVRSPSCSVQMESEAGWDLGMKKGKWTSNPFSYCEGDCSKTGSNGWMDEGMGGLWTNLETPNVKKEK